MISQDDIDAFKEMQDSCMKQETVSPIKQEHSGMQIVEFSESAYVIDMSIQYGEQP